MTSNNDIAWNNFVMNSDPSDYDVGDTKRSAAISNLYMTLVNNGGINSFLTTCYYLAASEVLESLELVGAIKAADQLRQVVEGLGDEILPSSDEVRWNFLDQKWKEDLDELDLITSEANSELLQALEKHVQHYESFYLKLSPSPKK